ncbi:UDP-N-acetylglucosamine 1-carboxyvinyltransferase [Solidesulfovibrio magneticus]|uniref:UDP-N-acetylglucosamine 1-carboxyvinyltransferase n=1 Tax=Solidesulfovibrio magneticus (strain ATCC 700980 / DSM 13731 / RS-1) TaxID=573370 RepID=MURA_SOLM1|nr:UDP-N-acetylglucosamine 1-carboxyvinyltransferase [Solidesulfovibrio magneticus]C4XR49.1 RecName: Full=UDP-N-acetylglucosamine 1-carboxyvinyltransferase; AltName: Full=Enoylpyruvate transferase; AltName: Full=UDP-N-acetylglucosamine enolpyruvyl transferase; Short=EPT [Solidesulfovibrio magneticus RS-1]BAH75394.1 UDP-N-acetylglucosamine 1-carboxyvinyltransferase [Solidesulfovibrio magneticus RS-1]
MDKLLIRGGKPLNGPIRVSGSKNAALPILLAAPLLTEKTVVDNVPRLRDIHTTLKLNEILGCPSTFEGNTVTMEPAANLNPEAPYDLVRTMRASVLVLGPLLARTGRARVALPGGCAIGARPVNLHLTALEKMGATFTLEAGYIEGRCDRLTGAHIVFDFPTVGGTENLLMAASLAEGTTILENAAREPEVADLADFLNAMGAKITGHGTSVITIEGVPSLGGGRYSVMPDRIEAATYMIAAAITGGELHLECCPFMELDAVVSKLREMGVVIEATNAGVAVRRQGQLVGVDVATQVYPGFPTDVQAQIMALMCVAVGSSSIRETIFENRFMHVQELVRLGAQIRISSQTAFIRGVGTLTGAPVMASDLRASASLVLAGLAAKGETLIQRVYHLDRGYEAMEVKLQNVGADIERLT